MSDGAFILPPIDGLPQIPNLGQTVIPERVHVELDLYPPESEPIAERHPWKASRTKVNEFSVEGGTVYGGTGTSVTIVDPLEVVSNTDGWKAWVKITRSGSAVVAAEFGQGTVVPADTDEFLYWVVVEFFDIGGTNPYLAINQIQSDHIRISGMTGGSESNHPWKVTKGTQTDELGRKEWLYVEGDVYTQGGTFNVAAGAVNLTTGFLYLKVERSDPSREATAVTMLTGATVPAEDYLAQYIPVAYVDDNSTDPPLQLLFSDVYLREVMLVENGEFQLAGLAMHHRTVYPPAT